MTLWIFKLLIINFTNLQKKTFLFVSIFMKTLKKTKIVNLNINSTKANPVHNLRSHNLSQQHINTFLKQQYMLNSCYQAIKIIAADRAKIMEAQQKAKQVNQKEPFKVTARTEKQNEIKLPLSIVDTIEVILKRFVNAKVEEEQLSLSTHGQYGPKKKSIKGFIFQKNKENVNRTEEDQCFKSVGPSKSIEKYASKVRILQGQLEFYKEKVTEQSFIISKLESRQLLLKKKFQDEVVKIMRGKNILNIHEQFGKQCHEKSRGKYLLNIDGKSLNRRERGKNEFDDTMRSSCSSKIKLQKRTTKGASSTDQFKSSHVRNDPLESYTIKVKQSQKMVEAHGLPQESNLMLPVRKNKRTRTFMVCSLKQEIDSIKKQKERLFDELTTVSQQYQAKMDKLDEQLLQKLQMIRKEEELLSDDELKMLREDNFQALGQMCGFYGQNEEKPSNLLNND